MKCSLCTRTDTICSTTAYYYIGVKIPKFIGNYYNNNFELWTRLLSLSYNTYLRQLLSISTCVLYTCTYREKQY